MENRSGNRDSRRSKPLHMFVHLMQVVGTSTNGVPATKRVPMGPNGQTQKDTHGVNKIQNFNDANHKNENLSLYAMDKEILHSKRGGILRDKTTNFKTCCNLRCTVGKTDPIKNIPDRDLSTRPLPHSHTKNNTYICTNAMQHTCSHTNAQTCRRIRQGDPTKGCSLSNAVTKR